MKILNWHIVPADELQELQDLSSRDARAAATAHARFNDPQLRLLANSIQQTRAILQTEVQRLQTECDQTRTSFAVAEAASAENERKDARLEHMRTDFVAAASHELKTPLAGIEALSDALQMALEDGDSETASIFAQHITVEINKMRELTEGLLDLSRFDENPDADSVSDLRTILEQATIMPSRTAKTKGIRLDVQIDSSLNGTLLAKVSPTDASIILDNLLENALHYTDSGTISVELHLTADKQMWLLSIRDSGMGIVSNDQQRVFERFFRAESSRAHNPAGTGLGLALVKKAVERWNGNIDLQSEAGTGSTFTVALPVA
ncbi:MAG: HAMP domain-containing histidine kinase [Coriobacteriia bacterium]|nr:HAMP domain-containing histidine kinase [Coriobacteriia bacterium]